MSPQAPRTRAVALALLLLATGAPAMTFPKRLHGEAKQLQEARAASQQGARVEEVGARAQGVAQAAKGKE
eukprot:CAMPEP_0204562412 /NCGR_PEP_ID=MMETSP0661-20131031/33738_1 /ASSEMBLY_ACC=CAM_ASM_000606 /TAXON_ID=109239 /ORGANISM="Alexandrium margalefi, Strain AMGDE01CS-322" /LENGTH=69 /DNA_ID=CAMNT_0051569893 /DNA_START=41 /DNA_END=247 /DNA_ORIENTATION=-